MNILRQGRQTLAWVSTAVLAASCAPPVTLKVNRPASGRATHAVAVYPFVVRNDAAPGHAAALGTALAERVARTDLYAVFGPGEFQVRDPDRDAIFVLTDLATVVPAAGVSIEGLVVMRGSLERRAQSVSSTSAQSGSSEQVTSVAHLELLDASSNELVAEAESSTSGEAQVDQEIAKLADRMLGAMVKLAPGELITRQPWWASAQPVEGGVKVSLPTGQATAAGLHDGDLITQVGSVPATVLSISRARRLTTEGETVPVTVHRPEGDAVLNLPLMR